MGRRKIEILPIQHDRNRSVTFLKHDRNRSVTFLKRKNGLFKKAYELGVLCSVDVAVIIFGHNNKVYEYCSTDSDAMVQRRLHYTGDKDLKTPADFGGDKASNQVTPPTSHPSLNLAALFQANPLLGLGMPGLNLGLGGLQTGQGGQQDLLAMLSANAANINQSSNALYSNPLFSTLFPNHPNVSNEPHPEPVHKPANMGGDLWPSLARGDVGSGGGDTSWLSFLGASRASQPPGPADDVDISSLFPFDVSPDGEDDDRGGKRVKR
ncbi:hypothetical protein RSAG8_12913, partial [Rhizoctonia solani AG-8 WAC10335]